MPPDENKTQTKQKETSANVEKIEVVNEKLLSAEPKVEEKNVVENSEIVEDVENEIMAETLPEVVEVEKQEIESKQTESTKEIQPTKQPKVEQQQTKPPQVAPKAQPLPQQPQPKVVERIIYKTPPNFVQNLLIKARAKIQERKRKKLDKIMLLFEAKPQITNKDIQKLLRTSSATTTRYLDILERENRIKQVGNTGKSVFYTKI